MAPVRWLGMRFRTGKPIPYWAVRYLDRRPAWPSHRLSFARHGHADDALERATWPRRTSHVREGQQRSTEPLMLDQPYLKKCLICGMLLFRATPEEALDDLKYHLAEKHNESKPVKAFEERITGEDMVFLRDMRVSHI